MTTKKFLEHFPGHHILISMKEDSSKPPIHYHDDYDDKMEERLHKANRQGDVGIFFTVNLLDESRDPGRHRTKKMVTHARAVFMDADDPQTAPLTDFPLVPSIIVETSPGKYHYYWLIDGMTDDLQTWNLVQRGLIAKYNGDDNAKDMTRYLRLPGFDHKKGEPFEVKCLTDLDRVESYSWGQLVDAFPPSTESKPVPESGEGNMAELSEVQTVDQLDEIISTGAHGLHQAINKRMLGMKRDGYSMKDAIFIMQAKGQAIPLDLVTDRITNRFSIEELERSWKGAEDDSVVDLTGFVIERRVEEDIGEMPWPPGLFGDLCQDIYNMSRFQYREVSIVTALGLVAGITGRRFNISDTGLNLYMTLIMNTGMGKDQIASFITRALLELNESGKSSSFIGKKNHHSAKALVKEIIEARSQVVVCTESGLADASKVGDRTGLRKEMLDIYTKSGSKEYLNGTAYSSAEDNIPTIRSPALTIVNETTPAKALKNYQQNESMQSGDLPRQSIFRFTGNKPYPNVNIQSELSPNVLDKLKHLIHKCAPVQASDDPLAYNMDPAVGSDVWKDMVANDRYWIDYQNDHKYEDSTRAMMASRTHVKTLKMAGICSVFNHKEEDVKMPEWEWAKKMGVYEIDGADQFFSEEGGTLELMVREQIAPIILNILNNKYKTPKQQVNAIMRKKGQVTYSAILQVARSRAKIKEFNDQDGQRGIPMSGLDKGLFLMKKQGTIKDVTSAQSTIVITETFRSIYEA